MGKDTLLTGSQKTDTIPDPWVATAAHLLTHDWPLIAGAVVLLYLLTKRRGRGSMAREMRRGFRKMNRKNGSGGAGIGAYGWRFVSGHHLDGEHRTDSDWFRRGRRIIHPTGRAGHWSYLSRAERSGYRLATLAAISAGGYGYAVAPSATIDSLYLAGAAGAVYGTVRARRAMRRRKHYREWVRPLHHSIATSPTLGSLGITKYQNPDTYLTVPVDYAENDESVIRMELPFDFDGGALKPEIERIVKEKLGLNDTIIRWHVAGHEPYVTVQTAPRPPQKVKWSEATKLLEAAPEQAPLIGLGPRGVHVSVDLDAEAPHVLVSASTGGGKSVIVRVIVSQLMRHGAHTIFLDAKRHSHRWARGLPNVTYCRSTEEIHDALVSAAAEGEARNLLVDDGGDEAAAELPRIVIVCEEMNATINRLQKYWETTREKSDPKRSPAIDGLAEVLFMGRAVKMNVIAVAQMMTARTLGGPEARENFAIRILARYSRNSWNMLVPEIQPMPRKSLHAGRVQVCIAGSATETQVLFPTENEAREWALSGTSTATKTAPRRTVPDMSQTRGYQGTEGYDVSDTADSGTVGRPTLTLLPAYPEPPQLSGVTLSEAIADGVLTGSLDAVRKASGRDPEFPDPTGRRGNANLYAPADLMKWQRNRPRAVG